MNKEHDEIPEEHQDDLGEEDEGIEVPSWGTEETRAEGVYVDVGYGNRVRVQAGEPFIETMERLADEAHYGGYYRVFLNGQEIVDPTNSPNVIEPGQRLAITSYEKVG